MTDNIKSLLAILIVISVVMLGPFVLNLIWNENHWRAFQFLISDIVVLLYCMLLYWLIDD